MSLKTKALAFSPSSNTPRPSVLDTVVDNKSGSPQFGFSKCLTSYMDMAERTTTSQHIALSNVLSGAGDLSFLSTISQKLKTPLFILLCLPYECTVLAVKTVENEGFCSWLIFWAILNDSKASPLCRNCEGAPNLYLAQSWLPRV